MILYIYIYKFVCDTEFEREVELWQEKCVQIVENLPFLNLFQGDNVQNVVIK